MKLQYRTVAARRGLTLMELIVVLAILIALAAIVVPLLPSMLSRSHDASAATNISEISKAVQTYNSLYFGYPNNLDNLIESTGGGTGLLGTLADTAPGAAGTKLSGMVTTHTLSGPEVAALNTIGITSVANVTGTAPAAGSPTAGLWSPTFFPYTSTTPNQPGSFTTLTTGTTVAKLTGTTGVGGTPAPGTGMAMGVAKMGFSPSGTYVMFGFGSANSAVGKTVQECPVHFPDQQAINPASTYQRYALIFYVSDANPAIPTMTSAQFVGVVCLPGDVETAGDHIQDYFQRSQQGN